MSNAMKWVVGCGLGCVVLIVLGIAAVVGGSAFFVRETMEGFEGAIETRKTLESKFGETSEFVPAADGAIPPDRLETFLAVREATEAERKAMTDFFANLPMDEEAAREIENKPFFEKLRTVFGITRSAFGFGADMGHFFDARNRALLQNDMGLGEYSYLYVLTYYSWLGHSPDDDITDALGGDDEKGDRRVVTGSMPNLADSRVRDEVLEMLRNQLARVDAEGPGAFPDGWRDALAAEVEALRSDSRRVPWQDGLPAATRASLEPFRDRLAATWDAAANPFELLRNEKQGRFSVQAE